ncbi:hypothetical protein AAHC03_01671 [Spirometra sp. Aus1]
MTDDAWPFSDLPQEEKEASNSNQDISLNMWGSCTPKTFMKTVRRTACLKPLHLALLREVLSICKSAGLPVFAYAGTALGLYREGGKMLPHDYDSDLAVLEYQDDETGSLSKLANFCLSSNIEVSGIEGFDGASVLLRKDDDVPKLHSPVQHLRVNWHFGNGYNSCAKLFERNAFFPLKSMVYEDLPILAPANLEEYLTVEYGYLGRDAMYDRETQRYVKISEAAFRQFPLQVQKLLSGPSSERTL